jgi:hypothetical protein
MRYYVCYSFGNETRVACVGDWLFLINCLILFLYSIVQCPIVSGTVITKLQFITFIYKYCLLQYVFIYIYI